MDTAQLLQQSINLRPAANGLAIIVANERSTLPETKDLPGVRNDLEAMKNTFEELRFATFPIVNATMDQIRDVVSAATARTTEYPPSYKRIAFVFAGHGSEGSIHTHTGPVDLQNYVFGCFQPGEAAHIGSIPKLFFIDACRGDIIEQGVQVPISRGANNTAKIPSIGNYILACASLYGTQSFERSDYTGDLGPGGFWIQRVAKELLQSGSVLDILTRVNRLVMQDFAASGSEVLQQPILESTLHEPLHLMDEAERLNKSDEVRFCFPPFADEQQVYVGAELHPRRISDVYRSFSGPSAESLGRLPLLVHSSSAPVLGGTRQPMMMAPCLQHQDSSTPYMGAEMYSFPGHGRPPTHPLPQPQTIGAGLHHYPGVNPPLFICQYNHFENHSGKQSIKYTAGGCPEAVSSGGYHATDTSARVEAERKLAAKHVLASLHSRGAHSTKDYKSELELYYVKLSGTVAPKIQYKTREISKRCGYQSTIAAPGMGCVKGECARNKREAEQSAALCMLKKIEEYADP